MPSLILRTLFLIVYNKKKTLELSLKVYLRYTYSKNSSVAALEMNGFVILGCAIDGFQQSGVAQRGEHSVHGNSGLNDVKK